MPRSAAAIAVVLVFPALISGTPQRTANDAPFRMIRGHVVVDDPAAVPLRRVRITMSSDTVAASPSYTDDQGRFELLVPSSAQYSLKFSKAGFAPQDIPRGPAPLPDDLMVRLARGAAITGRVVDQFGDPLLVSVRIRRVAGPGGATVAAGDWTTDGDDLGDFRVGSLPDGIYDVTIASTNPLTPPPRPGAGVTGDAAGAPRVIQLRAGEEVNLSLVQDAEPRDPRGLVIGGSRTPVVDSGATIRGRVLLPDSRPVGGAFIMLFAGVEGGRQTSSNADGSYEFSGLPAGTYRISAGKIDASLTMVESNRQVTLKDGQTLDDVALVVQKLSAVGGVVLDEYGDPVEGVNVDLLQASRGGGRVLLQRSPGVAPRRTDDRGRYRLFPVRPGEHYLSAGEEAGAVRGAVQGPDSSIRVYYPGTAAIADATPIRVVEGRDTPGVNIAYAPTEGARVNGYAFDAAGEPLKQPVTMVESFRSGSTLMARRTAVVRGDGAFEFLNVPPGDYVVQGIVRPSPGRSSEFGVGFVSVSGADMPAVIVRTSIGTPVKGRVLLEGDTSKVQLDLFAVGLDSADVDYNPIGLDLAGAGIEEDGAFEMRARGPMRITSRAAPQGWWLKSAMLGAVDIADQPYMFTGGSDTPVDVAVVFSDGTAEISGRVSDARGQPARDCFVLVFPVDRSRWSLASRYIKIIRAGAAPPGDERPIAGAAFRVSGVPPGDYWVVALDRFDPANDRQDTDLMAELASRAERITVREHETIVRDLRLVQRP